MSSNEQENSNTADPNEESAEKIVKKIKKTDEDTEEQPKGQEPLMERIVLLHKGLKKVRKAIEIECQSNERAITHTSILCILIVLIGAFSVQYLFSKQHQLDKDLDWMQFTYIVVVRITVTVTFLSLASFCFKLLRSYLHIYHNNKHRKLIIKSMSSLLEASDPKGRELIFKRLLDIILKYSNTGFLTKENDFKNGDLTEMLKKVLDKIPSEK